MRAVPVLPVWAIVSCSRVNFTFTFYDLTLIKLTVIHFIGTGAFLIKCYNNHMK